MRMTAAEVEAHQKRHGFIPAPVIPTLPLIGIDENP